MLLGFVSFIITCMERVDWRIWDYDWKRNDSSSWYLSRLPCKVIVLIVCRLTRAGLRYIPLKCACSSKRGSAFSMGISVPCNSSHSTAPKQRWQRCAACFRPQPQREGYMFRSVCLPPLGRGMEGVLPPWGHLPKSRYWHPVATTAAFGTHLTGMHSCFQYLFLLLPKAAVEVR